ncbi:hypothetical protein JCM8097_006636 [Rhodosporidiobolus ruineniae]
MLVPPLPLEIVDLIVVQVRLSCGNDDHARRSNGRSAALVCRAWRDFGTAMFWKEVVLNSPAEAACVEQRFNSCPGLGPLVKKIYAGDPMGGPMTGQSTSGAPASLYPLLRHCSSLGTLSSTAWWTDAPLLLQHASQIPSLDTFFLRIPAYGGRAPDPLPLLTGLQHLSSVSTLAFQAHLIAEPFSAPPPPTILLRPDCLILTAIPPSFGPTNRTFSLGILNAVDPATLSNLAVTLFPRDDKLVRAISRFHNLDALFVDLEEPLKARPTLDAVLQLPAHQPKLKAVIIKTRREAGLRAAHTPTLSSFLASLPLKGFILDLSGFRPDFDPEPAALPSMDDFIVSVEYGLPVIRRGRVDFRDHPGQRYCRLSGGSKMGWCTIDETDGSEYETEGSEVETDESEAE